MTRRDLLRLLLASPLAAAVDLEKLLWAPKPIVTVPAIALGRPCLYINRIPEFIWQMQREHNRMLSAIHDQVL